MASSSNGCRGGRGQREAYGRRRRSPSPDHPYEYITLPGGDRFDIPEGDDKEKWVKFFDEAHRATREVIARHGNGRPADGINRAVILDNSSHRDGSIYAVSGGWHQRYRISDRNETGLEPMTLSDPSNCSPDRENCFIHIPAPIMQIFSVKLGKLLDEDGPVQLYGYIATRDLLDPLLNYIVNRSREDPIIAYQGSLIEMTGPKRGIEMRSAVLIEYDLRIKKGEHETDDMQLIDGVSGFSELTTPCKPFLSRIDGVGGAVDITLAMLSEAVEATIEVDISQVHGSGFRLLLSSSVGGLEREEIHLFSGVISEACGMRRFVVAAVIDTWMHVKFKVIDGRGCSTSEVERYAYFKASMHGCASQQMELDQASITVKVTWSTMCMGFSGGPVAQESSVFPRNRWTTSMIILAQETPCNLCD